MTGLFYPLKRTTLHIPGTGPAHDRQRGHLFIVLNDPCQNKKNLMVCVNSAYPKCDRTCLLTSGHDFIRHESFVAYERADVVDTDILVKAAAEEVMTYEGLFAEEEFEAVFAGVALSPHTRPRVKSYFHSFCLI